MFIIFGDRVSQVLQFVPCDTVTWISWRFFRIWLVLRFFVLWLAKRFISRRLKHRFGCSWLAFDTQLMNEPSHAQQPIHSP